MAKRTNLERAASALATGSTVAHLAFLALFGWRSIASFGPFKLVAWIFMGLALLGAALGFAGGLLAKYGRRTPAAKVGYGAIALSTALAAALLVFASWT